MAFPLSGPWSGWTRIAGKDWHVAILNFGLILICRAKIRSTLPYQLYFTAEFYSSLGHRALETKISLITFYEFTDQIDEGWACLDENVKRFIR